jgi:hypothetical protein
MDEELFEDWVTQPPAAPIVQHLRDAEREAAWRQLAVDGGREDVLDVASEATVTAGLPAERIARVDFSQAASERAREVLGDDVAEYTVVDPSEPTLPFERNRFDGAASLGPYDWTFLDVSELTDELHRVCNGAVVLTTPTHRSPYAAMDGTRMRYYDPGEALALLSPDWRLTDRDLLYQLPARVHQLATRLPPRVQESVVALMQRRSERYTREGRWRDAAHLVLGAEPLPYDEHLADALDCLFRPVEEDGFWDEQEGRVLRALRYRLDADEQPVWRREDDVQWRYAPMALLGATRWRASGLGTPAYDAQLREALAHFRTCLDDGIVEAEMPSYGIGPLIAAFALAADALDEPAHEATARELFEYSRETYEFAHAEDSLLLFGWAHLYETAPDERLREAMTDGLWTVTERLTDDGLFAFDNHTTRRHQNQMYTLWGLCRAAGVLGLDGYLDAAERVLSYTIDERMLSNGALVWEDLPRRERLRHDIEKRFGRRPPHWDFLYSCHQTFFVNAVAEYYRAGGTQRHEDAVRRAVGWIYGDNDHGLDLHEFSGIGVPMRFLTTGGRMDVPDQMYKGAYEVGSYLMMLTNLMDGPFDAAPSLHRRARTATGSHNVALEEQPDPGSRGRRATTDSA